MKILKPSTPCASIPHQQATRSTVDAASAEDASNASPPSDLTAEATPETTNEVFRITNLGTDQTGEFIALKNFARKLERERDGARKRHKIAYGQAEQWKNHAEKLEAVLEACREYLDDYADGAPDAPGKWDDTK